MVLYFMKLVGWGWTILHAEYNGKNKNKRTVVPVQGLSNYAIKLGLFTACFSYMNGLTDYRQTLLGEFISGQMVNNPTKRKPHFRQRTAMKILSQKTSKRSLLAEPFI